MEELDINRWVRPFYLDFLHGNFANPSNSYSLGRRTWHEWSELLRCELSVVTPETVGDLMMDSDWRPQICGAYFGGLNHWDKFTLDIGRRLVAKQNGFATQGYAFALARMPSHAAANYLCGYLSRLERPKDTTDWYHGDVEWVIAALQWVDAQMSTHRIEPYISRLVPLWQKQRHENLTEWYQQIPVTLSSDNSKIAEAQRELQFVEKELDIYFLPDDGNRKTEWFWNLMEFCEEHFDSSRENVCVPAKAGSQREALRRPHLESGD